MSGCVLPSSRVRALPNCTVRRASMSFWRSLAGLSCQSSGTRPAMTSCFSLSVFRCLGADTRLASIARQLIAWQSTRGVDLAGHGDIAGFPDRQIEPREQRLDRPGLDQPLAERPDRLGVRHPVGQTEPKEAHKREPVVDQEFRPVVAEAVLRLDDQDLEHHDRVERRPPAPGAIAVVQCPVEIGPENLEIHHRGIGLKLVTNVAQALINVEQSG